jgi:hypothetical protein
MKRKPIGRIEDETLLLPHLIAEYVVEEAAIYFEQVTDGRIHRPIVGLEPSVVDYLANHAQQIYEHNESFRKLLRSKSNRGRDSLYAFMRHWTAGHLKDSHGALFALLPQSYLVGNPLPIKDSTCTASH